MNKIREITIISSIILFVPLMFVFGYLIENKYIISSTNEAVLWGPITICIIIIMSGQIIGDINDPGDSPYC